MIIPGFGKRESRVNKDRPAHMRKGFDMDKIKRLSTLKKPDQL